MPQAPELQPSARFNPSDDVEDDRPEEDDVDLLRPYSRWWMPPGLRERLAA
jgi:hypothetical protein